MALTIFYDGDCPFCTKYVQLTRLREAIGPVRLVDLRAHPAERADLEKKGFNLDHGMVVETEGAYFAGADATNKLARLAEPSGLISRLGQSVLGHGRTGKVIYPVLRSGRWLTLFLLGRPGFAEPDAGLKARQSIFGFGFALYAFLHAFLYNLPWPDLPASADRLAMGVAAIALLFRPESSRLLFLVMLTATANLVINAPVASNHMMVSAFVVLGYWIAFAWSMIRGSSWDRIFACFAPAGQGALMIMYFFGVFHKINTGFLDPATSCAVALWREMPAPLSMIDVTAMHYLAIYGTFIVEGGIVALLLMRRYRHIGVICGIGFHALLALSNYADYITFTMLSISLHLLFIGPVAARNILGSKEMGAVQSRMRNPVYLVAAAILAGFGLLMALLGFNTMVTLLLIPILAPICWIVLRRGQFQASPEAIWTRNTSGLAIAALTSTLFFANCMMPYAGLKTGQAINMFANLRLEAGVSNHLVFHRAPGPFRYLEDVVVLDSVEGYPGLKGLQNGGFAVVYYELLNQLERNPDAVVSYVRNGVRYTGVTRDTVADDIDRLLHPRWFRNWFHFQPVNLQQPEPCNV